jgi:magnesium-transporting ATPase (P-type)
LDGIDVNPDIGISTENLAIREKVFGSHYKEPPVRTHFFALLLEQLQDFMLRVLIVCAIFAIVIDMSFATPEERGHAWIEGVAILIAVIVVSFVTAWSDYTKEGNFL